MKLTPWPDLPITIEPNGDDGYTLTRTDTGARKAYAIARPHEDDALRTERDALAQQVTTAQQDAARLREALVKVRAHTSYVNPTIELLAGLLASIERIADAALTAPADPTGGQ
jgi:hypothetical protein